MADSPCMKNRSLKAGGRLNRWSFKAGFTVKTLNSVKVHLKGFIKSLLENFRSWRNAERQPLRTKPTKGCYHGREHTGTFIQANMPESTFQIEY